MRPALTPERIDRATAIAARVFEVPAREIRGRVRIPAVARARLALYAALYEACETGYKELAWHLQRDHSTIIYGVRQARALADFDTDYAIALAQIRDVARYS